MASQVTPEASGMAAEKAGGEEGVKRAAAVGNVRESKSTNPKGIPQPSRAGR
jgi:hypothetical protein